MDNNKGMRSKHVLVVSVLGTLCLVGLVWFMAKQPMPVVSVPGVEDEMAQRLLHRNSRRENMAGQPDTPIVVHPIRSGMSATAKSNTSEWPSIEVCLVEALTRLPVTDGRIAIREEHSRQILGDYELGSQNCALFQIDPGRYSLQAGGNGYLAVEQTITVDSTDNRTRKVFSLFRHVLVRGMVTNSSGQPQSGACVTLFQETYHVTARSGAGGRFEVELFNPEIQRVYAFRPPHPIVTLGPVIVRDSKNPNLEITLPEDVAVVNLSGMVSDDLGHPVAEADVTVIPTSTHHVPDKQHDATIQGLQQISAKSDAQGRFSLEVLSQDQALVTVAGAKGCEVASESIAMRENVVKDIHLKCHPTFSVSVEKEDGNGVADAVVVAESAAGERAILPTPEKGRYFALAYPFRIFAWTLWPNRDGYGVTRSEWIKNYQDPIRLVLGQARVDGVVRDMSGEPIRNFSIRVSVADTASHNVSFPFVREDGSFSLKYLPPGKVTLEVMAEVVGPGGTRTLASFSAALVLVEGQSAFLLAVLKPPEPAETAVADRSRQP